MVLVYEEVGETCQRHKKHRYLKLRGILTNWIVRMPGNHTDLRLDAQSAVFRAVDFAQQQYW